MDQCSPLGWLYFPQEEDMGELKRILVQTTMELEATVLAAQDEILKKDEELTHIRDLLKVALKERDEAQLKCRNLQLKNSISISLSSSDSDESIISEYLSPQAPSTPSPNLAAALGKQRELPEKGRLLQAVMEAGPILQTLLLAGPLPQWQHPPPQLDKIEIPTLGILHSSQAVNNKRRLDSFGSSVCSSPKFEKYQRP